MQLKKRFLPICVGVVSEYSFAWSNLNFTSYVFLLCSNLYGWRLGRRGRTIIITKKLPFNEV